MTLTSTLRNALFYGTLTATTAFGFASPAYADGPTRNSVLNLTSQEVEECRKKAKCREYVLGEIKQGNKPEILKYADGHARTPSFSFTPQEVEECRKNTKCREDILKEKKQGDKPKILKPVVSPLPPRSPELPKDTLLSAEKKEEEVKPETKPETPATPADPLNGAPGYTLRARIIPKETKTENKTDSSALETLIKNLQQQVQTLQEQLQNYLSSHSASVGISEGFEQIDGKYGLFTAVDLALRLEDWISLRAGAQASYATTALSRTNTTADQGRTTLGQHLVERWSYSKTDSESYRNALAFSAAALLGSLDGDTFGVKGLDAYLALGGKVRLVEGMQQRTEQRTSQLLYRGEPRDRLQSPVQVTADSTLLPLLIPTAGIGVCYGVFDGADICAEFSMGLRVENPDKPGEARLETDGSLRAQFKF